MTDSQVDQDAYGHVINGPNTYRFIAQQVVAGRPTSVMWSSGLGDSVSFLFAISACHVPIGKVPWCGLHPSVPPTAALVIAARGCGMMAVPIFQDDMAPMHPDYVAEKLWSFDRSNPTIDRAADLINGVFVALRAGFGVSTGKGNEDDG